MRRLLSAPALVSVACLAAAACSAGRAPVSSAKSTREGAGFSGERGFAHLRELAALGPRVAGTATVQSAREYVRSQLLAQEIAVEESAATVRPSEGEAFPDFEIVNLMASLPGVSPDFVILAAPLDMAPVESFSFLGANEGASGAALLLELARTLHGRPLPYTVRFAFLDGEAFRDGVHLGTRRLALQLRDPGELQRLRLLVYFDRVGDRDLRIARDVRSDRALRDAFFHAAARVGEDRAFPLDRSFGEVEAGHTVFVEAGFRRVVALVDREYGGEEAPGVYWRTAEDTPEGCAPESLASVGRVTLATLDEIFARFAKLDRLMPRPEVGPGPASPSDAEGLP